MSFWDYIYHTLGLGSNKKSKTEDIKNIKSHSTELNEDAVKERVERKFKTPNTTNFTPNKPVKSLWQEKEPIARQQSWYDRFVNTFHK